MAKGIWVSPTEFVSFADGQKTLSQQIATRDRSIDFTSLGMYLPNPDPILKRLGKDISVYTELLSDASVGSAVGRRVAAVKALEYGVCRDNTSARCAKILQSVLDSLDMDRILSEILNAAMYGYQPLEVMWGKVGSYLLPTDIVGKPADWFLFNTDNELRFKTKQNMIQGEALPERKFLLPRKDASYNNPYGRPNLSMCFWPVTFKKGGLKFWVTFAEKYGSPWIIGKHPRGTSTAETDRLLDNLEAMVQDAIAVIPDDSSVEINNTAGNSSNGEQYERLLMYCRSEISIALLGQNQTTEANSNRASATAGLEVTASLRNADAEIVKATFNQLFRWICELNFNEPNPPKFDMWEQEEVDKILAERDQTLTSAGAKFTNQYFVRAYNLQPGDLQESGANTDATDASFAEGEEEDTSVQDALDAAIDKLDVSSDVMLLLQPILKLAQSGVTGEELMGALAELYPKMPADKLEQRLAQVIFVSKLKGRLHG